MFSLITFYDFVNFKMTGILANIDMTMWILLTVLFALPLVLVLLCDQSINGNITWGGYAANSILLLYVLGVLPIWFKKPNPVIFVPVDFAAIGLFLFYLNYALEGNWFLTFAFPTLGGIMLIVTTVVTLMRYVPKGGLYIFGGAFIATGVFTGVMELLLDITFRDKIVFVWSIYPFAAFFIIGMALIVIAICKPLRESLQKKFFV